MENVVRGKLKLKSSSKLKIADKGDKKKKKKSKKDKRDENSSDSKDVEQVVLTVNDMTPAQRRYEELRKKREEEEIEKVASKTYRERVEDLNQYLGRLTEHHDVPRVSAAGNG